MKDYVDLKKNNCVQLCCLNSKLNMPQNWVNEEYNVLFAGAVEFSRDVTVEVPIVKS